MYKWEEHVTNRVAIRQNVSDCLSKLCYPARDRRRNSQASIHIYSLLLWLLAPGMCNRKRAGGQTDPPRAGEGKDVEVQEALVRCFPLAAGSLRSIVGGAQRDYAKGTKTREIRERTSCESSVQNDGRSN